MALQNTGIWNKYYYYGTTLSSDQKEKTFLYFHFIKIILMCFIIHIREELLGCFKPSCHPYHGVLPTLYRKVLKSMRIKAMISVLVERRTRFHCAYSTIMLVLVLSLIPNQLNSHVTSVLPAGGRSCIQILSIQILVPEYSYLPGWHPSSF